MLSAIVLEAVVDKGNVNVENWAVETKMFYEALLMQQEWHTKMKSHGKCVQKCENRNKLIFVEIKKNWE